MTADAPAAARAPVPAPLTRPGRRPLARPAVLLAALGPGVIGLIANNDAGGMLSYLATGAGRDLGRILPALAMLGALTLFIQWIATRVALATRRPYSRVVADGLGRAPAVLEAVAMYGLNAFWLVTEFMGMALALGLAGVPRALSLPLTCALVIGVTSSRAYPRIERLLLPVAAASLAFIPALLFAHHAPGSLAAALSAPAGRPWFLLLALAGNAIAPWMVYWQQNAVWAGAEREQRARMGDLATGAVAFVLMAAAVIVLGAVTRPAASALVSPVRWIYAQAGPVAGILFAVGLFQAGLLAACTVSLASLWTLREALGAGAGLRTEAPNRGPWLALHAATLVAAAAVALLPGLAAGRVALWANALAGVWMPVTMVVLLLVSRSPRVMGQRAVGPLVQAVLAVVAAGFVALAVLGLAG